MVAILSQPQCVNQTWYESVQDCMRIFHHKLVVIWLKHSEGNTKKLSGLVHLCTKYGGNWLPFVWHQAIIRTNADSIGSFGYKLQWNINCKNFHFHSRKHTWKCRLQTVSHFIQASMFSSIGRTLGNKLQWNYNWNWNIFIKQNLFENIVCKMTAILSGPQYVNSS